MATLKASSYQSIVNSNVRQQRRALAATAPEVFAGIYLASDCSCTFSRMHLELFASLSRIIQKRRGRLAIAAPRGHAKSTIVSLVFVLWCLLHNKEKLILIVSATKEQAETLLKHITEQLQHNRLLLEDFPEVCRSEGASHQPKPWRKNRILLRNGAMVMAYGEGQSLRGARNGNQRPGLIVVDDLEDSVAVIEEDQRAKLKAWFNGTLLHAGHPETNVVVVGTVLHHDSLLANLLHPETGRGWLGSKYQAVEQYSDRADLWEQWAEVFGGHQDFEDRSGPEAAEAFFEASRADMLAGTKVLWPEWEDYHALMAMRVREGHFSFEAEKQNEPLDPDVCLFAKTQLRFWEDEYPDEQALLAAHRDGGYFYGACDPSLGKSKNRGDYTAIVILLQAYKPEVNYVVVADIARRSPDQTIERIVQYAKMYKTDTFVVEANNFQELLVDNLEKRAREVGVYLYIDKLTSSTNKHARIAALQPYISQGRLIFSRKHQLLLDQLRAFPVGRHDDGPDALEMAAREALKPRNRTTVEQI